MDARQHRGLAGRLVIATHNPGKLREMRELLEPFGVEAVAAGELGLIEPGETGETFRENARIKAAAAAQGTRLPAFSDDSGLAVHMLGGAPGIHSARWAGPNKDFRVAMEKINQQLYDRGAVTPQTRTAHFVSALCIAWPDGHIEEFVTLAEAVVGGAYPPGHPPPPPPPPPPSPPPPPPRWGGGFGGGGGGR